MCVFSRSTSHVVHLPPLPITSPFYWPEKAESKKSEKSKGKHSPKCDIQIYDSDDYKS